MNKEISITSELKEIKQTSEQIQHEIKSIKKELKEIKENNKQQRNGQVMNGWLDVLKYSLPTAVIVVGLLYLIRLFG